VNPSLRREHISSDAPIVVLPLGAWEQHGDHLPFDTDTLIINAVVQQALAACAESAHRFVVAPAIAITASDEHDAFVGGLSMGTQALTDAVIAICRSAHWAQGICVVNGHGGNVDALSAIDSALNSQGTPHVIWSLPIYQGSDMHAGHTETSVLLHIAPHVVDMTQAEPGATGDASALVAAMRERGVGAISYNGVIGDPTTASSEHGAAVMALYSSSLAATLKECAARWTRLTS
jgi:creatinine amidohydrolase